MEILVSGCRDNVVNFASQQLQSQQPRDDYREFLELSIIYLGRAPSRGIRFQAPGAMHHARWLAKVLYAVKMWLFRSQFRMTKSEQKAISEIAAFGVTVYLKAWMTAPMATEAPYNDFLLMKQLLSYPEKSVSTATSKKLGMPLWYLSEDLVPLAQFYARVPDETKKLMVSSFDKEASENCPKRAVMQAEMFQNQCGLEQFCSSHSRKTFQFLQLPTSFLTADPATWHTDESFTKAQKLVRALSVVNDRAERGVALIQNFSKQLTKDEEQFQFLLQVIKEHRKQYPDSRKSTMATKSAPPQSSDE